MIAFLYELFGRAHTTKSERKKGRSIFDAKFSVRLLSYASTDPVTQVKRILFLRLRHPSNTRRHTHARNNRNVNPT